MMDQSRIGIDDTLRVVRNRLDAGMTTHPVDMMSYEDELYYIKTWFVNDPMEWNDGDLPTGVIMPSDEHRVDQYVQEDTEIDSLTIFLYMRQISRVRRRNSLITNPMLTNASMTAMVNRATSILRDEPTYTHLPTFLRGTSAVLVDHTSDNVIQGQVLSSQFRQPGFTSGGTVYMAEIRYQVWRRVPWAIQA